MPTGLYATIGILAALRHRDATAEDQHVDVSLLDTSVACLVNEATNFLVSGHRPVRRGHERANIVPYKMYPTDDGYVVLAVGNDGEFRRWCQVAGVEGLGVDSMFATNAARVEDRGRLDAIIGPVLM